MRHRTIAAGAAALGLVCAGAALAAGGALPVGPSTSVEQKAFIAYYDGHKDTYLVTDVSSKAQATAMHINYSKEIGRVLGAPAQYFIYGKAVPGQLSVLGSEPGESDYNPLWEEFSVRWKPGVKPVLLVRDDQIKGLAKSGKLTPQDAHVVLNAPVTKMSK